MAQRYLSDPRALERMSRNTCPECGYLADSHALNWWEYSLSNQVDCSLRADGVRERIAQYELDERTKEAQVSNPPELF